MQRSVVFISESIFISEATAIKLVLQFELSMFVRETVGDGKREIAKMFHALCKMSKRLCYHALKNEVHCWKPSAVQFLERCSVCQYLARPFTQPVSNYAYITNYRLNVAPLEGLFLSADCLGKMKRQLIRFTTLLQSHNPLFHHASAAPVRGRTC